MKSTVNYTTMNETPSDIISNEFAEKYKNKKVNWGFNGLGYVVYKRTYSRQKLNGEMEEWPDTIQRCINGAQKIGAKYTKEEAERLFDLVFNLKCNFAGRSLWQLGTPTVDRFGANSLINCFFLSITKLDDFCFLLENLMLGSGVGFSVRKEHIHELPRIKTGVNITNKNTKDADFIVPDSREGWVRLLHAVLKSYFYTGKSFSYSTILVRGKGEKINGFGGTASGPQDLIKGIEDISKILKNRENKKLRSVDVLDVCNIIASIVVAGNVRRSSELSLGDADDHLFIRAKRWDLGNIPNWRAMSNNTICADDFSYISDGIWDGYSGNGEPYGLFNLPLTQKHGRLGDEIKDNAIGTNPCCMAKSKDVWVITKSGYKEIKTINKDDLIWVDTEREWCKTSGYFSAGISDVYKVDFDNKTSLYVTSNHKLMSLSSGLIELKNLKIGDSIRINQIDPITNTYSSSHNRYLCDFIKIISISYCFTEEVGCIEVEKYHQFTANGIISGNSEISLEDYESCNLAELYLNNISSKEELIECSKLLYKTQKAICSLNYLHKETTNIVHKNMRLGLGVTGICQSLDKLSWLDDCYKELRKFDKEWSKERGWNKSIKLTTIKPSGCQVGSTLVITNNGIMRLDEIGNIYGDKWQNINFEICQENKTSKAIKFYNHGISKTKKIKLSTGLEMECSLEHKYRILKDNKYEWISANNIKVGDLILYKIGGYVNKNYFKFKKTDWPISKISNKIINFKKFNTPTLLNEEIAWFLGLYFADGSNHSKGIRIAGNIKDINILKKAQEIILKEFNIKSKIYERTKSENNADLYINNTGFLWWLKEQGVSKDFCENIKVPTPIRLSSSSSIKSFINGFKSGDGAKDGKSFVTVSKEFALEMMILMRSVGIDCKCKDFPPTESSFGGRMRYWVSDRKCRLLKEDGWKSIRKDVKSKWKVLNELGLNTISFDKVESISDGENYVYDIEVPENNTYISNSIISHNTLSLLSGSTPGVHPAYSKYYIRRIRMSSDDKLVDLCKQAGYRVEFAKGFDGQDNRDTIIVEFPCFSSSSAVLAKDMSAIKQLELVKRLQTIWSDNAVSCTVYYKKEELPEIKSWLKDNYENSIKSVSFLLHKEHGFSQAPYEEISEEKYNELISNIKPIKCENLSFENKEINGIECSTGHCPIK